jgi:hypothetical protein
MEVAMRPEGTAAELEQRRNEAVRRLRNGAQVFDACRDFNFRKAAEEKWKRAANQGRDRKAGRILRS